MVYSEAVKRASEIAFEAHKDDLDLGDYPYFMHPLFLAFQMNDEDSVCAALLHDVIEDHGDRYSFDTLVCEGFNDRVVRAVKLLTHDESVPYMDYVRGIKPDPIARAVKIADLRHNLDVSRRKTKENRKDELYKEALKYLTED